MGRAKSRWNNKLQNYWTSERVRKKNMHSEEEGRGYYMQQKAIFIKTILPCERRDS
jgi:hypothetical protein